MTFAKTHRGRELPTIIQILAVFGTVEQRQLRQLFRYLGDYDYGRILARLKREGLAGFSDEGGGTISAGRYSGAHADPADAALVFWAFLHMRDRIRDFCASDPPAILTFTAAGKSYDLIPGSAGNIPAINAQAETAPEDGGRFIVVRDLADAKDIRLRPENDYLVLTGSDGVKQIYEVPKEAAWKTRDTSN